MTPSITILYHYAAVVILNVILLSVDVLKVIMLRFVMLGIVVPFQEE
jgi:hypothetical protein